MITFFVSLILLFMGYFIYSKFIEKIADVDDERITPAYMLQDNIDFVPMPWWKIFLIQFLNIAGLGPIFGAIAGAMWGPVALIWIVVGSIFAGAVHDYFSGMLSMKHNGLSISEIVGIYLGKNIKQFTRWFSIVLLVIVGAVFITGPAKILAGLTPDFMDITFWAWIILMYYIMATLLPIDKLIGKIYPIFGFALGFMALGLIISLFANGYSIPEISIENMHSSSEKFPIFPMLFITIACGAISGFHSTQSPLMARCVTNEGYGRRIFYGAMITEGVVALIWAVIGMSFYGGVSELNDVMLSHNSNAAFVVNEVSNTLLGKFGAILALLGVVAAPITSGDTAFRSARLVVADLFNYEQAPIKNRLIISIPLFIIGYFLTTIDFGIIWRYFAWANQTLAMIVLWTITVYLLKDKKNYWVTLIPAVFMTAVTSTYILIAQEGFALAKNLAYILGIVISILFLITFFKYKIDLSKKD